MLGKILGALLPAVITIVLGYFAARHHDFEQEDVPVLNRMVIGYALPLSLFVGVVQAGRSDLLEALPLVAILAIAMIGTYAAIFVLGRFVLRYSAGMCAIGALAASAPSSAFVGAPVLSYFYGDGADIPIAVSSIILVLALVPVTVIILSLETGGSRPVRARHGKSAIDAPAPRSDLNVTGRIIDAFKQPVVWLPLLGFIMVLLNVFVPKVFADSLDLLGQASAGVALFASGIILAGYKVFVNGPLMFVVFVKNILQPALVLGAMAWLGYSNPLLGQAVLTSALPSVVLSVMLAVQYQVAAREAASALFISTVGSMLTMSVFIWFLF
jgi:malonate transporter and related proteins